MTRKLFENEAAFERECRQWLDTRRIFHFQTHSGNRPPVAKGVPDLVGILPGGRFFGCEIKRPTGSVSPSQWVFLQRIREAGGLAVVVTSIEELRDYFGEYVR